MALSKEETNKLRHESHKAEHKAETPIGKKPISKKTIFISISSVIIVLIAISFGYGFIQSKKPGPLDSFAQCLTEKGAVMYGASFCKYTSGQKGMFGNSMKFIDYRDFTEDNNIRITPTWKINGEYYQNAQSLDRLASITGCAIGK
ncbi:hypothetical protein HYU09_00060 [Candidatus Woesearchaeota archaeon]|nr:hypothetical protein [Candidatus Woesearchaeota archaeon]